MKKFSLVLIVLFSISLSCKKEYSLQKFSISDPITDIGYSAKTFAVSNQADLLLKTPTGLKIHIPAYSFVNKLGQVIADNIIIEVKEYLRPGAMILYDKPSSAGGRPLESGGEFLIGATSGTEKLKLAPGVFIQLDLPKTGVKLSGMRVFNGVVNSSLPDNVDWAINTNSGNVVTPIDSSSLSAYSLFCDSIDWINCDRYAAQQVVDYTIYSGNSPDPDKTIAYIHFTGRNSVISADTVGSPIIFRAGVLEGPATVVGICIKNGERYVSLSSVTMKRGGSVTMNNFIKMTEEELKQKLRALR